jgi:hypothetical protein
MSHILTPAQLDEMANMREAGLTYGQIARHFETRGVHIAVKTIGWQCARLAVLPAVLTGRHRVGRKATRGRGFTIAEDARLVGLRRAGKGPTEIAAMMSRPKSSVIARLYILGRNEALAEREQGIAA